MNIWDIINVPLGYIMKLCYMLTHNYAFALFLFALALQILLLPFGIKQQKNTIKQASLRPKEQAIRKKYAGRTDQATQQKLNNEIMELYQRENFNPMGGCLPLLIQMPILFSLYNVVVSPLKYICGFGEDVVKAIQAKVYELMSAAEMTGLEAFAEGVKAREIDLVTKMRELGVSNFVDGNGEVITDDILPNFTVLGGTMDLSAVPSFNNFNLLLLIPLFTLIVTLGSSWIMKKFTYNPNPDVKPDASMRIMQLSMPLLSVYISFTIAAAIGLYWIFRNILSVVEKIVLSKVMPLPQFTEEDYKAAEREANVKVSKKQQKKKVRSLHRIDEEDEEEAPAKEDGKPALKEGVKAEDAPKLKDDEGRHKKDKDETKDNEEKAE